MLCVEGMMAAVRLETLMAKGRQQPSLSKRALEEARKATRWQVVGVLLAVAFSIGTLILTLVLFSRQQSAASPNVRATACPAIQIDAAKGVISECIRYTAGSPLRGMEQAVRVDFANDGGGGITVKSMSLICLLPAHCGMHDISTAGVSSASDPDSLPIYLAPGQSSFFAIPIGCDHSVLGYDYKKATAVEVVLQLSTGKNISTVPVPVSVPNSSEVAECDARIGGPRK
jgi:hypothetical protein